MGRSNRGGISRRGAPSGVAGVPIIGAGVFAVCGVAAVTFLSVHTAIGVFNDNADAAYAAAYDSYMSGLYEDGATSGIENSDGSVDKAGAHDIVEIDGKWYITSGFAGDMPVIVDPENTVIIDGVEYMRIDANTSTEAAVGGGDVPFYGEEYVVVDIDGNMVYLVEKGDTLSDVSGRVGYSVQELARFNGISNVNLIYNGQTLRVPAPKEAVDYVAAKVQERSGGNNATTESGGQADAESAENTAGTGTAE